MLGVQVAKERTLSWESIPKMLYALRNEDVLGLQNLTGSEKGQKRDFNFFSFSNETKATVKGKLE